VFRNQQTRSERANGRPKLQACGNNHGVGQPPVFRWNVLRNQFGRCREIATDLSYAEEQPERSSNAGENLPRSWSRR